MMEAMLAWPALDVVPKLVGHRANIGMSEGRLSAVVNRLLPPLPEWMMGETYLAGIDLAAFAVILLDAKAQAGRITI